MVAKPTRRLFTVREYCKMGKARILKEDERVELIEGEIIQMPPIGVPHALTVDRIASVFARRVGDRAVDMRQGIIALVAIAVLAISCAPPAPATQSPVTSPQSSAPRRITTTIRGIPTTMAETRTLFSMSNIPGLESIDEMVHSGLTQGDDKGVLRPRLAEAVPSLDNGLWVVFPDGRMETTWRIRSGARWHDDVPFTADDLVFTVAVEQDKELGMPRPAPYEIVESVEAVATDTVRVRWKRPYIEADAFFAGEVASPLPKHLLEKVYADDKTNFLTVPYWTQEYVGAGPFRLREWALGSYVILTANDAYVLGRPKVDEVEVRFVQDQNALVASLLAGAIDLTMGRTLLTYDQALQVTERRSDARVVWGFESWYRITPQFVNTQPPIVADVRLRRALMHAMDRQQMVDTLMGGLSAVAHSYVSPYAADYPEIESSITRYEYDLRRAAEIIEGMGYSRGPDGMFVDAAGHKLSFPIRTTTRAEMNPKVTIAVIDDWRRAGFDVEPEMLPAQRMNDRELRATFPSFEMIRGSNSVLSRDVKRLHSSSTPLPENRFQITGNNPRYRSAELDGFIERYLAAIPRRERMEVLGQIVRHLTDQLPWMGLFYDATPTIISTRLNHATGRGPMGSQAWNSYEWELK